MAANIISKITVKSVCGKVDVKKLIESDNEQLELIDIFGLARKALPDESPLGSYIKFRGSFKANNLQTGETVQSGALILPKVAEEFLAGAFNDETVEVKFGFRIGVKYDDTSIAKYVWTVIPLTSTSENDPLVLLENQIKQDFERLTAPAQAKKSAKKPEQVAA